MVSEIGAPAPFDPRQVLAAAPVDEKCTYIENSVSAAQWQSVLYRVGQRDDATGHADPGTTQHPRLTLTHRGSFTIQRVDQGRRISGRMAPGRSWLVPPGEPLHYDWSGAGTASRELAILVLPRQQLDEAVAALEDRPHGHPVRWEGVRLAVDDVVDVVLRGIRRALAAGLEDLYAQTASAFLIQHLLTTYGTAPAVPVWTGPEDARVRDVIVYLHDNLHLSLTLADMARVANLSQYHFLRVFRATTGLPPRRYLNQLRIEAARRRLGDLDVSISDIATLCGFGTPSHFSSVFRRVMGTSPRAYRNQLTAR